MMIGTETRSYWEPRFGGIKRRVARTVQKLLQRQIVIDRDIFLHLLGPLREERVTRAMWNVGLHQEFLARSLGEFARSFVEAYARTKQPGRILLSPVNRVKGWSAPDGGRIRDG